VASVTYPYGRILDFLDRSRYFFFHSSSSIVLTRLSGLRSGRTGNQTRASGSVARQCCLYNVIARNAKT
jgi:hypothetical protein